MPSGDMELLLRHLFIQIDILGWYQGYRPYINEVPICMPWAAQNQPRSISHSTPLFVMVEFAI